MKKRSLLSRRDAIRMKIRKAVSLKPKPCGQIFRQQADQEIDVGRHHCLVDLAHLVAAPERW